MWDETFERLVRSRLPGLPARSPLARDCPLPAFGLDSIATVSLIAALEDAYALTFPDDVLVPLNFRTPGAVWSTLSAARDRLGPHSRTSAPGGFVDEAPVSDEARQ